MGNCFGFQAAADPNPSSANSIIPSSTPGTSRDYSNSGGTSREYSNGVGHSATSSSAGLSRFSAAFSDDGRAGSGDILPTPNLKVYSFSDLKNATRSFKSDMVLGVGGFGTVYRGWVDEKSLQPSKQGTGMMVAIKKLNPQSMQGFEEWQKRKLKTIMDARLQGQYSSKAAAQAAQLTLRCLEQEPRKRPPMKEVAEVLEQIAAMEKPKVSKSSRVYDLWEKLVGAVLDREELRRLALRSNSSSRCSSFSDYSSCFSFGDTLPTPTLKVYSFGDLKCATRDFRSDMVLGIGDFGTVYKGWVDEKSLQPSKLGTGMMVAIKKLNPQSMQDFDEWQATQDLSEGWDGLQIDNFNAKISDLWLVKLEPSRGNATLQMAIGAANEMAFLNASYSIYRRAGQYSFKAAARAAQLTLICLEQEPRDRPPMEVVAEVLEQIAAMEKPEVSTLHQSRR
ncbi:hypothetical protein SASPL_152881 [Salvia splendens]|uniref:Serine/threonine-protein kinase PBS1 n=1 Tax=Salvia splendens TaxID=180675 RepID=A0A8X8Z1C5_SALSN|nr:hypothetical protein SASPL_152881 [Salvia splendens]